MAKRAAFMKKSLIVFAVIILIIIGGLMAGSIMFAWLEQNHEERLTPAEKLVEDKYDSTFVGALFGLRPDEWADGKVYKRHYKHGIYEATFQSNVFTVDFGKIPEDSLKMIADAIHGDLLHVIRSIDLYDSIHIRYMTSYKNRQPGEWPSADTSMYLVERRFSYGLR